jgi:hypothetical protein
VPRTTLVAALVLALARDPVVQGWRTDRGAGRPTPSSARDQE